MAHYKLPIAIVFYRFCSSCKTGCFEHVSRVPLPQISIVSSFSVQSIFRILFNVCDVVSATGFVSALLSLFGLNMFVGHFMRVIAPSVVCGC